MSNTAVKNVAFVGIGNMGWPMARNVFNAGFALTVFDNDRERAKQFAGETGARWVASVSEISDVQAVVTMLPNGKIVRNVLLEAEDGALVAGLAQGSYIVDMSSAEPQGTRELAVTLKARGIALIDAPVSGGVGRAEAGTLAIMAGADSTPALEAILPLLRSMGQQIFPVGRSGCGHALKALNNYVGTAAFAATSEALLIGERFGLDPNTMVDVMNVSTGRNFHTDVIMKQHVVSGAFGSGFALGLLAKDLKIAADLGNAVERSSPLLDLVAERCVTARDSLGPTRDFTELYLAWKGQ